MHEKNFLEKRSKQDLIKLCEYKSYNITQLINKLDNHINNIKKNMFKKVHNFSEKTNNDILKNSFKKIEDLKHKLKID